LDVDADGSLSALDALTVVNYINRSAGGEEILASQVNIEKRIERLEEAMDSDLLPPNIDLTMAKQIREVLRAGGFPEMGDRMLMVYCCERILVRRNQGLMISKLSSKILMQTPATQQSMNKEVMST
jgi:hypothetical protein